MNEANAIKSRGKWQTKLEYAFIDLYSSALKAYFEENVHIFVRTQQEPPGYIT